MAATEEADARAVVEQLEDLDRVCVAGDRLPGFLKLVLVDELELRGRDWVASPKLGMVCVREGMTVRQVRRAYLQALAAMWGVSAPGGAV